MASANLALSNAAGAPALALKTQVSHGWNTTILYGTVSLLCLAPLVFGAVEGWAIFALQCGATGLLLAWAALQWRTRQIAIHWNPLFAPMIAFAGLIAVQLAFGLSAYRHVTASSATRYTLYGMLVFLFSQSLQRTSDVRRLTRILTAYGSAVALFAVVQSLSSNGKIYWMRVPELGGWIYGPYVNHNHYAGLMEMLFPIALVAVLTHHPRGIWRRMAGAAAVLMASTIFLSGSRGGMIAFLGQMIFLGACIHRQKTHRTALVTGVIVTLAACLVLWVGGQALVNRVASIRGEATTEVDGGLRLAIDRDCVRMMGQKPLLGWGLATFSSVYPQFRSFYTDKFANAAHNDYLQLMVETGTAGGAIAIWFLVVLWRRGAAKLDDWASGYNGAVAMAALMGCVGILIHSCIDFNLQIPANAALFYVLCAAAAANTHFMIPCRRRHHFGLDPQFSAEPK